MLTEGNGHAKVMKSLRAMDSLKTEQYSEKKAECAVSRKKRKPQRIE